MIKEYLHDLPLSQAAQDARDSMRGEITSLREEIARQEAMLQNITRALNRQLEMLEEQKAFRPLRPRNGYRYIPPAAFRHLQELGEAMLCEDEKRVLGLQNVLAHSGYEVPTTIDEVAEITERLQNTVNIQ